MSNRDLTNGRNVSISVENSAQLGTDPTSTARFYIGIALLFGYICLGLSQMIINSDPEMYDGPAYLLEANRIDLAGGLSAFPGMVVDGEYQQSNQHPLYILSLVPFAEVGFDFLVSAKFVSLFFGIVAVSLVYILTQRLHGHLVATLATTGFMLTHVFVDWSTIVACESLLIVFVVLGTYSIFVGFHNKNYWMLAGLFIGLAFLTKVTALLLLPGFCIAAFFMLRRQLFKTPQFYSFFIMFLVGCSPLLINQAIVFGNPFYNKNIDNLTGRAVETVYHETSFETGSMIRVYGSKEAEIADKGDITFEERDIVNMATGVLERIPREFTMFLETLSIWPLQKAPTSLRWVFGGLVLGLFVFGALRDANVGARVFALSTVLVFIVALSLHRPLPRYLLPVNYFVWIYASIGLLHVIDHISKRLDFDPAKAFQLARYAAPAVAIAIGMVMIATRPLAHAADSISISPERQELASWMRENIAPGDRYVEGPNFRWAIPNGLHLYPPVEARESSKIFEKFLVKHEIRYVIVDWTSMDRLRYRGRIDRRVKFDGKLEFSDSAGIVELDVPATWTTVLKDKDGRVDYIVYALY